MSRGGRIQNYMEIVNKTIRSGGVTLSLFFPVFSLFRYSTDIGWNPVREANQYGMSFVIRMSNRMFNDKPKENFSFELFILNVLCPLT